MLVYARWRKEIGPVDKVDAQAEVDALRAWKCKAGSGA